MPEFINSYLKNRSGLRGYYKLDDLVDSSGNGLTLANTGTVAFATGRYGKCADMGSSMTGPKYLTNASVWTVAQPTQVTMGCWIKMNVEIGSSTQYILDGNTGTSGANFSIRYDYNSGARRLQAFVDLDTVDSVANVTINLGTAQWYHVVMVRDTGAIANLYLDGKLAATHTGSGGTQTLGAANLFMVGNSIEFGVRSFTGLIDDAFVYQNVALNAAEIGEIYSNTLQRNRLRPRIFAPGNAR